VVDGSDVRFNHVFFDKGPAHSRAHRIVQGPQGFIWLATADRLQRYDGYDIREYPPAPGDPSVFTESMLLDRSGTLWAARDRGIGLEKVPFGSLDRYDPASGTFIPLSYREPWFQAPVADIGQDRGGALWFSTSEGLVRMDPATGRTARYRHSPDDPASLSSNAVRSTLEAGDGTFWVATSGGVDLFDRAAARVIQRIPLPQGLPAASRPEALAIRLFEDHAGVLWAALSYGYGLARVDRQAGKFIFYSLDGAGTDGNERSGARAIQEDRNGALWIGTVFSGILKLGPDRTRFTRYRNNPADPDSPAGDAILDIFLDREGNMWVGTNDAGVDRFATNALPFKRYRHEVGNPNSLETSYTTTVFEDSRRLLWVGSRRSLGAMNRVTDRISFYRKTGGPGELSDTWVHSVAADRSGYLWFGTQNGGLNRFDRRTGRFKVYRRNPADLHSLVDDRVFKVFVDHTGCLWAGTEKGLESFDAATETFQPYLPGMRIRDIAEDANGVLWIAARATGLVRLDTLSKTSTIYHPSSDKAWAVTVDHSGIVWVATENGLNRFDPATQSMTAYYESDGLADNSVSHIVEDERGDLWVSTHNGLSRFNPREKTFKNYYVSDGLAGNEFYDNSSSFKSARGEMFFSANGGLTAFFPRDIVDDPTVPPVAITDFKIFGKDSPLKSKLSYSENVLTFGFSALSYASPERNRYRYRLEPLETQWNESHGDRRTITYALSPGEYVFRVQASNSREVWNLVGASARMVISPPWWATWQFRTLIVVLILLSLGYANFFHLQRIRHDFNTRLEGRVDERLRVARELHDTLLQSLQGLLLQFQGARNLLPGRAADAGQVLDCALENAAQAITEARDTVQNLRSSTVITNELAKAFRVLAEGLAAQQREAHGDAAVFSIEVEGAVQELHPILRDEIFRITGESLRNAFRHARALRIEVEIRYDARKLRVRVRDDGIGIDAKVIEEGRTGHWGLPGMRERAKAIGSQLEVWSEQGAGTEVELTVPASVAYGTNTARTGLRLFRRKTG
jgi:signal transduction histidine kinase/ligand-binding sensor domain-containing protein